jgi:DNA polymerase III subunit epsilon
MKYLFFDTETTGLPRNYKAPASDTNNWPRLVQLAFMLFDEQMNLIEEKDFIIRPDGFSIPVESSLIHGISDQTAREVGLPILPVLERFKELAGNAHCLVAHNYSFDVKIMGAEFIRAGYKDFLPSKNFICTMQSSTNYCALPSPYGYKWPKLTELHYKLFKENFKEAHNAAVDIRATARCFRELLRLGVINDPF